MEFRPFRNWARPTQDSSKARALWNRAINPLRPSPGIALRPLDLEESSHSSLLAYAYEGCREFRSQKIRSWKAPSGKIGPNKIRSLQNSVPGKFGARKSEGVSESGSDSDGVAET